MYQLAMARAKGGMSMQRYSDKAIEIVNDLHTDRLDYASEYIPLIDAAQQLAAYEDTGLAPVEVQQMQWIPVEERLPEEKQRVIVRCERVGTSVGWILWGNWMTDIGPGAGKVTHWMPLPHPPKEATHD